MGYFRHIFAVLIISVVVLFLAACGSVTAAAHDPSIKYPEQVHTVNGMPVPTATAQTTSDKTHPVRLNVPSLGINAPIEQVGTLTNGDLATPVKDPWVDAGWYSDGPHPGERGSAVIDGHLDRPGGFPAVFWYLRDIRVGASVVVTENDGKQIHFRVTHIAYYTPQNAPLQDIFGNNAGNYLNLITCAGDWIPNQHQTTLRLVIYTTLS